METNHSKINFIEGLSPEAIFVKTVQREEVDWSQHAHNKHQLIYTISGTLHITVGQEQRECYFVTSKHLVWIPANTLHQLSTNNAQVSLLVCCFTLSPKAQQPFSIFITNEFTSCNLNILAKHKLIHKRTAPELFDFFRDFLALLPLVCKRSTYSLKPFIVQKTSRLYPILAYIDHNYASNLTISSVAKHFAFSARNLTRMFTNANIRFVSYLNHVRIVKSLELLADNKMSIEHISYEVGFNSPTSFNRVFKKITGSTPSSYLTSNHNAPLFL